MGISIVLITSWLLFSSVLYWRWRVALSTRQSQWLTAPNNATSQQQPTATTVTPQHAEVLIVYASATGNAQRLADEYCLAMQCPSLRCDFAQFATLTATPWPRLRSVLFIVSTAGDGEPPESAAAAWRQLQQHGYPLPYSIPVAILGLGDKHYPRYCAFASTLAQWLQQHNCKQLFAPVFVDKMHYIALQRWRALIAEHLPLNTVATAKPPLWRLVGRTWLNEGSSGLPLYHLQLQPLNSVLPNWQAGDLVDIRVPNGSSRTYSIASTASAGTLDLVVRQVRKNDGSLGVGSGWLTERIDAGSEIPLRIRSYPNFHAPAASQPLILIGAGSGYAGLRAHLQQRVEQGKANNGPLRQWLIFGERNSNYDAIFKHETQALRELGHLLLESRVYSRDSKTTAGNHCGYVQDILQQQSPRLQQWLMAGACIYICGSNAMGQAVLARIAEITSPSVFAILQEQQRIKAELY